MNKIAIIILSLGLAAMGLSGCGGGGYYSGPSHPPSPRLESPPASPSNLTANALSHNTVNLQWTDNSGNEGGFRIYRDDEFIETVRSNLTTYEDTGLKPNTIYTYLVRAYNDAGESLGTSTSVRTPNPPITVTLDRIGVYDNGEHWLRGEYGEVYVYIVVSDGKKTTERMRFPRQEGQHYDLKRNDIVDIGTTIFSVDEVGDSLIITVVGYESDGSEFELLVYKALGAIVESQIAGGAGLSLEAFNLSLGGLLAEFFGLEDDWLGSYERTWNYNNNWGIGRYTDIACEEEDGTPGLRLWFTIESHKN